MLDLSVEMDYYNVPNPYGAKGKYCQNHFLCLWQVTEHEVIGHWDWNELVKSEDWYGQIVMPAFRAFRKFRDTRLDEDAEPDISVLFEQLSCKSGSK